MAAMNYKQHMRHLYHLELKQKYQRNRCKLTLLTVKETFNYSLSSRIYFIFENIFKTLLK